MTRMNSSVRIFGLYVVLTAAAAATDTVAAHDTSIWDVLPVTAQLKSAVQLIAGDTSGAARTQMNFLNEGIGSSQLRSAYFLATGQPQKAWDVQKKCFSNLEGLVDGAPIVGHVKGAIHLLAGDNDHGWDAIKSATSTAGTVLGGLTLGPVGALVGRGLTDAVITVADKSLNGAETTPYGYLNYVKEIGKLSAGEHFDAIAGLALDTYAGAKVRAHKNAPSEHGGNGPAGVELKAPRTSEATGSSSSSSSSSTLLESLHEGGRDGESAPLQTASSASSSVAAEDNPRVKSTVTVQLLTNLANTIRTKVFLNSVAKNPDYAEVRFEDAREKIAKRSFDEPHSRITDDAPAALDVNALRNSFDYLAANEKSMIAMEDFRTVNTGTAEADSTLCAIAGIVGEDVGALKARLSEEPENPPPSVDAQPDSHFKELTRRGIIEYSVSEELNGLSELDKYIVDNADSIGTDRLVLTETSAGTGVVNGYALKIKKLNGYPEYVKLLIDYSTPAFLKNHSPNPYRVVSFVNSPDSSFKIYVVRAMDKESSRD